MAGPGRPKIITPPPREITELSDTEIAAIAPLTKDGAPDMYNYMPTRLVPLDEAQQRGWSNFYDGRACRFGHQAPRYVSNVNMCVDCHRGKRGKTPIGGKSMSLASESLKASQPYIKTSNHPSVSTQVKPLEPDAFEKRFLVEYAAVKDLDRAAKLVGSSAAQIHMRLSTSTTFRAATNDLETRLQIKQTVSDIDVFVWDEDKRTRYITIWVNSGDKATARDSIRATMTDMQKEFRDNPEFLARCDDAAPLANLAFEERAQQLALAGNDKLLALILKAERPEKYSERVNVNMNVTEKMTDDQLDNRLRYLLKVAGKRGPVIDAEWTDASGETPALTDARGDGAESVAEHNSDLL
jgi:hypothetical protein